MMTPIRKMFAVPETENVKCVTFTCGHERILSASDFKKLPVNGGERAWCVECERQAGGSVA